jgi:hypothetical protein
VAIDSAYLVWMRRKSYTNTVRILIANLIRMLSSDEMGRERLKGVQAKLWLTAIARRHEPRNPYSVTEVRGLVLW